MCLLELWLHNPQQDTTMYAKVFSQIYDGTLCTRGPWQALVTFQQMLVLADQDGNVDITAAAIARRTTIPLEIIELGIEELLKPDPESRTPTEEGRRLIPLSEGRSWGWRIVNYKHYRDLKREQDRRDYHKEYWHKRKERPGEMEKIGARKKLNNAVRSGIVDKPFRCEKCDGFDPEAHHDDYAKPLEVKWLCKNCHEAHHHNSTTNPQHTQPSQPITEAEAKAEEEAKNTRPAAKRDKPASTLAVQDLVSEGVSEQHAQDWFKARKRTPLTQTAWAKVKAEAERAGMSPAQAVQTCAERQWRGFDASWLHQGSTASPISKQAALERRNAATVARLKERMKNGEL